MSLPECVYLIHNKGKGKGKMRIATIKRIVVLSGLSLGLMLIISVTSFAGFVGPGEVSSAITDVESINNAGRDDANVTLEGYIIRQISEEYYIFKDDTGDIRVEIYHAGFRGQTVSPETRIRIFGTLDKGFTRVSVDVDYLEIIEAAQKN